MPKKWKWKDDYDGFGFTCIVKTEVLQKPQFIFCETASSNANVKPYKLQEHFDNGHGGTNVLGLC